MRPRLVSLGAASVAVCALVSSTARGEPSTRSAKGALPRLDYNAPVWCLLGSNGQEYRAQYRVIDGKKSVLVAPNSRVGGSPLRRVRTCGTDPDHQDYQALRTSGIPIVPAVAEAPRGWYRDEEGRVFQVSFDLQKRLYVGAGWHPRFDLKGSDHNLGRGYLDMGFRGSFLFPESRTRHTIRALEGQVTLDDLEADGQALTYDLSHASDKPLVRLTTFFGEPKRHDLYMDVAFGLRAVGVHHRPHRVEDRTDVEYGELHVAWDIWQSDDLYNHARLQLGTGVEGWYVRGSDAGPTYAVAPNSELSLQFGLDRAGFHYLDGAVWGAVPVAVSDEQRGTFAHRAGGRAGYEVILLAVNDQPVSLRLETRLSYRDDLPDDAPKLDASAFTGMRFSFWAPARADQPISRIDGDHPRVER